METLTMLDTDRIQLQEKAKLRKELIDNSGIKRIVVEANEAIPTEIMDEILSTGLVLCGAGKSGKTTFARVLNRELMKIDRTQIKVFDTAMNWVKQFEPIWYQILSERLMLNFGTDIYLGNEAIIFECSDFTDTRIIRSVISKIVAVDYELHRRYKWKDALDRNIVYTIEEAQNILNVITQYGRWSTYISQGRNYNLSFIFIVRSMADLSSKARKNIQAYLWGKTGSEIDLSRIKKIAGDKIAKMIPHLEVGEFIYWNGKTATLIINKDIYDIRTKPKEWIAEIDE